ncbi:hypothetical protein [Okeania sp. SIO2B9]|nr:hypothetical protein [Okeania sp. SIO2B9]
MFKNQKKYLFDIIMTINTQYFVEANQLKRQGKLEQAIALYY